MRAPHRYSGTGGPGTLVMVQWASGERRPMPAVARPSSLAVSASVAAGTWLPASLSSRAPTARDRCSDDAVWLVDQRQPLQRVGDVGAQGHAQPGQLGAAAAPALRAHVERCHRGQAGVGQFAVEVQVAAQRAAAHRQHGVVDGGAGHRAADGLEFVEREAARLEHAVRRDHRVEARRRQLVRPQQQVAGQRQRRRRGTPHGAAQRPGQAGRGAHAVRHAAPHHAQRPRAAVRRTRGRVAGRPAAWRPGRAAAS